jgi:hypothetical protein
MDCTPTAEERTLGLVGVEREEPGGGFYIVLRSPSGGPVHLGPYQNRDVAAVEAALVRRFLAAVIREVRATAEAATDRFVGDAAARSQSSTMISSTPTSTVNSSQIGSV